VSERVGDERDGPEVVHLIGLGLIDGGDEAGEVGQVALNDVEPGHFVDDGADPRVVLAFHQAVHLVALRVEEFGEVLTVLAGDPGDERSRHPARLPSRRCRLA
jgi:hypothetical protein